MTTANAVADSKIIFVGPASSDVKYFLLYSENVAEINSDKETRAHFHISYLYGPACRFCSSLVTLRGELTDDLKNYDAVNWLSGRSLKKKGVSKMVSRRLYA